ncbi:uncharacterized protein LOC124442586 [Xenia sp. Carnegie-2017]|uniref:uncharacterized protein LOC124442586 n=1 Tax=Xenia sp. Carnegie-2017 TaxID=2897299 RepID=UPI001F033B2C|nr:uncharacterized protein LOC124442586 [Xenia sp. Carnegie-2017]
MSKTIPLSKVADNSKLKRSFSWESSGNHSNTSPVSNPTLPGSRHQSPCNDGNNNKTSFENRQLSISKDIESKDWSHLYLTYVELKIQNKVVLSNALRMFRNSLVKDLSAASGNFKDFVGFMQKELCSVKSSHSNSSSDKTFDEYDVEFIGMLGVSLLEKCSASKSFNVGYEVLHVLHTYDIVYFNCGKNFGLYNRDISSSSVALLAVKLCLKTDLGNGLASAFEVLRSSNFATPEDGTNREHVEYRIKLLQQVFHLLLEKGNISDACQIIEHLNVNTSLTTRLYSDVVDCCTKAHRYDEAFKVVKDMESRSLDLNCQSCQSLYQKFLTKCLSEEKDEDAIAALEEMESRSIMLNALSWQKIMKHAEPNTNEFLINMLFERCKSLAVYTSTFSDESPWLCQLGCGYTLIEVKLIIMEHLKQLQHFLQRDAQAIIPFSHIKDFEIILSPSLSEGGRTGAFAQGRQPEY